MSVHEEVSDLELVVNTEGALIETSPNVIPLTNEIIGEQLIIEKALRQEEKLKGKKLYHNLTYLPPEGTPSTAGPRACFIADYGSKDRGKQKRILKKDRKQILGRRAKIHYEQGCTTLNDFDTLVDLGPEAYKHHISPVLDFWITTDDAGKEHFISAEKYFEGYRSINLLLPELKDKPLTRKEFDTLSSDILDALGYIDQKDTYHRDFSLRNIITNLRRPEEKKYEDTWKGAYEEIRDSIKKIGSVFKKKKDSEKLEAIVTDFANACYKSHPTIKPQATMGATQVADILMIPAANKGITLPYTDKTEVYSIAKDFLEMLVGEQIFSIDPSTGTAKILKTRFTKEENLFDEKGIFKKELYDYTLKLALYNEVPKHARKYNEVLQRALSSNEIYRYSSTQDFIKDWKKHGTSDWLSKTKRYATRTLGTAMIASQLFLGYEVLREKPAELFKVESNWVDKTNEIENNFFRVSTMIYSTNQSSMENPKAYIANQGTRLSVNVHAYFLPISKSLRFDTRFSGKVYFEGVEPSTSDSSDIIHNISVVPVDVDFQPEMGMYGYYADLWGIKLPENVPEGTVRNLVIELYPTVDTLYQKEWLSKEQDYKVTPKILFNGKDKPVIRKTIPIILNNIGSDGLKDSTSAISLQEFDNHSYYWDPEIKFKAFDGRQSDYSLMTVNKDIKYVVRIPEIGYMEKFNECDGWSNVRDIKPNFPKGPSAKELTLQTIAYKNGHILNQTFLPISRESTGSQDMGGEMKYLSRFEKIIPDTSFSSKVMRYSREATDIMRDIKREEVTQNYRKMMEGTGKK
jgi:serine/threonine protein kinase